MRFSVWRISSRDWAMPCTVAPTTRTAAPVSSAARPAESSTSRARSATVTSACAACASSPAAITTSRCSRAAAWMARSDCPRTASVACATSLESAATLRSTRPVSSVSRFSASAIAPVTFSVTGTRRPRSLVAAIVPTAFMISITELFSSSLSRMVRFRLATRSSSRRSSASAMPANSSCPDQCTRASRSPSESASRVAWMRSIGSLAERARRRP